MLNVGCISHISIDSTKILLSGFSFSFAIMFLILLRKRSFSTKLKVSFIYAHLITLFFPFVLLGTNITCGVLCMSCYNNVFQLIVYSLPTTLAISALTGFIVIPTFYIFSNKKTIITDKKIIGFVEKYCKKLNIKPPKLYAVDKAEPVAFSFRSFKSTIFLSVGLLDILNQKETEGVILHELFHIKDGSSILKLSSSIMRIFSPLSILTRFSHDYNEEERKADDFAVKIQKTKKYLVSAKRKMYNYNKTFRFSNLANRTRS